MVVHENDGRGVEFQGSLDDFARIERHMIDGALLLRLVGDQGIVVIQKENTEMFVHLMRQRRLAVIQQRLPGGDHRPLHELVAQRPEGNRLS